MTMIWIAISIITGIAALSVLWPLARPSGQMRFAEASRSFYDDQIAELQRDRDRGLLGPNEYAAATAEAARRLISAHKAPGDNLDANTVRRRITAVIAIIVIPCFALGLYVYLGQPRYEDRPLLARLNAPPGKIEPIAAVAKIEKYLAKNPGQGKGWEVLAPVYVRLKRYSDAVKAWERTIALLGPTAHRFTSLGEARVFAAQGKVTAKALQAFKQALRINPGFHQALFFTAIAAEQAGNFPQAEQIWRKLIAISPPGAPWIKTIEDRLKQNSRSATKAPVGGAVSPGPQSPAGRAIAALPPEERAAAIRGMIEGLAERLNKNGNDLPGWLRLIRAYGVSKQNEKGAQALVKARGIFAGNENALKRLDSQAMRFGIKASQ